MITSEPKLNLKTLLTLLKKKLIRLKYQSTCPDEIYNSDIFIVEFPKSGITWFSTILANIYCLQTASNIKPNHYNIEQLIGDLHQSSNIAPSLHFPYHRTIKSHAHFNPYYRHVIYLVRNPYSVMESYYHFLKGKKLFKGELDDLVKDPKLGIEAWVSHVNSWIKPKKEMKFHLVRYEGLINDPKVELHNLCVNLGYDIDKEIIEQAIARSSFNEMKASNNLYKENSPTRRYDFVRSGQSKSQEMNDELKSYIYTRSEGIIKKLYEDMPEFILQ